MLTRLFRRFATLRNLAATLAFMVALAPSSALADNAAIAINTKNGSNLIKIAFKIERIMSDVVAPTNAAIAISSCSACQTVAIAIDVVFVTSDPKIYTPTNIAVAMNIGCTSCNTLASAYQFVITTGGPVHLTPEGREQIDEIRERLERLRHSRASIFQIQSEVNLLMLQLQQVLSTQLVPVPPDDDQQPGDESQNHTPLRPTGSPSASSSPVSNATPTFLGTPVPAPSPTPSATP